jgi:acyl dehydratase
VIETQTLVYREAAAPDAPLSPPPPGEGAFDPSAWDAHRRLVPSTALLFRYSALTANGHRIHYDHPYVTGVEGYPGLVFHGPLTATLLMALGFCGMAYSFYPFIVPERLTIAAAAASPESLSIILMGVVFVLPVILGYTAYVYWLFRAKVTDEAAHH